jgi:hypothetical protein
VNFDGNGADKGMQLIKTFLVATLLCGDKSQTVSSRMCILEGWPGRRAGDAAFGDLASMREES